MESSTIIILLGAVALAGGAFYLYQSGKLVSAPTTAMNPPKTLIRQVSQANIKIPAVSGYHYAY